MRTLLPLLLVGAAVAAAAPVQAAFMDTTTAITVEPVEGLVSDDEVKVVPVTVHYCFTAGAATVPTPVSLSIAEAPWWLVVELSPATLYFNVLGGFAGLQQCLVGEARVSLTSHEAPEGEVGTFRLVAHAHQNGNLKASTGADDALVRAAGDAPCHHAETTSETNATAEDEPVVVETQAAAVAPVAGPLVGGLAVAGAAAGGLAAARRRK